MDLILLLESLREPLRSLEIISDETWLPWELLRLILLPHSGGDTGFFLGESFATSRWLAGAEHALKFPLRRIGLIAPLDSGLRGVEAEAERLIARLKGPTREVVRIPARYLEVTDALASGSFDAFHIAAHGTSSPRKRTMIILEEGERLTPQDLSGSAANFGAARPLVFFSGPPVPLWARHLLGGGAGAVIGPYWPPRDEPAVEFADSFYRFFVEGYSLAESVLRARLSLRDRYPGDPSWLTFTVFGHPLARCKLEAE